MKTIRQIKEDLSYQIQERRSHVGYVYFFCLCLTASLAEGCNIISMIEKFADILACFSCFTLHFVGKNSEKTNLWLKTLKKAWKISFFDKTNELRFLKGFDLFLLDRKHTKNTQEWIKRLPYMFFVEFFAALVKQYSHNNLARMSPEDPHWLGEGRGEFSSWSRLNEGLSK